MLKNECYNVYLGIHKNTTGLSYISSSLEVLEYIIVTYIVYTYIYYILIYYISISYISSSLLTRT